MVIEKERNRNWLKVASLLLGALGIVCILPAVFISIFLFDKPGSIESPLNLLLFFSVISFPIICIISSLAIWFLKDKFKKFAYFVFLLPVFPLIIIFALASRSSDSTMQRQGNAIQAAECAFPVFDGGDGLDTTVCGVLKIGANATGTTKNTSEAHNWQFSAQNKTTITIENDGRSCPQMSILDSSGKLIKDFKAKNGTHCLTGMKKTAFFYFDPPTRGTYIIRITTPETPGAYWLKIE